MGITKKEGFDTEIVEMSEVLKALGHPARLSIVEFLANTNSCISNQLVEELPLAQPTISRHLSELKRVGIIKGTIEGKNICYCINQDRWEDIQIFIKKLSLKINSQNNCC